ncbi:MAG: hypothetical protein AB1546_11895 [bacterium]
MNCPFCGKPVPIAGMKFCTGCGRQFHEGEGAYRQAETMPAGKSIVSNKRKRLKPFLPGVLLVVILAGLVYLGITKYRTDMQDAVSEKEIVVKSFEREIVNLTRKNERLKKENEKLQSELNQLATAMERFLSRSQAVRLVYKDSKRVKTKYYDIEFVGKEFRTEIEKKIDGMYKTPKDFMEGKFDFKFQEEEPRVWIKIFKTEKGFNEYMDELGAKQRGGAFYIGYLDEIVIYEGDRTEFEIYKEILHETVHYIIGHHIMRTPLWLNEGLAVYLMLGLKEDYSFEYGRSDGGLLTILMQALHLGHLMPFKEFIEIDYRDFEVMNYQNEFQRALGYAQSWMMVSLFLHSTRENEKIFVDYVKHLLRGGDKTIGEFIGTKRLGELEADWKEFLKNLQETKKSNL